MQRMNIAVYWEQDSWGGVDSQLLTLLRTWPAPGDRFTIIYNRGNPGLARIRDALTALPNVQLVETVSFSYNEIVRRLVRLPAGRWLRLAFYPLQPLLLWWMTGRLAAVLRRHGPFDVVLADNGGYPAAWGAQSAVLAARRAGVPARFLLVHHAATRPAMFMQWYERLVDRAVSKAVSAIICVSHATRRTLFECRAFNDETTRLRVIHNGIALLPATGNTPPCDLRATVGAGAALLVGIVGRIEPYKGHEDLIFALARLDTTERARLHLVVLGSGAPEELARLRRLADKCGGGDAVHFPGYVAGEPVDLIAQFDLLVIATRSFEGYGLTLAEAMHAGTPILSTRVGAVPEFVDESNGALVNPGSPLEMAQALRDFLANRPAWQARAAHAQQRIRSDGNRMADEYHRLFAECLAEQPD